MNNTAEARIKALKAAAESMSAAELQDKIEALTNERIAEIKATKTEIEVKGQSYYVSAEGCDDNDGKTPQTP